MGNFETTGLQLGDVVLKWLVESLFGTVQKVHILSGAETFLRPYAQWPPDYIHMPKL